MANLGISEAPVPDWYKQNMGAGIVGMNQAYDTVYRDDARNLGMILNQLEAAKADQAIRKGDIELRYQEPLAQADLMNKQGIGFKSRLEGAQAEQLNNPVMLDRFKNNVNVGYDMKEMERDSAKTENFLRQADLFQAVGGNAFQARQAGVSPEALQELTGLYQSGKLPSMIESIKGSLVDSVGQRQKVQVEHVKGQWDLLKQKIHNEGIMGAASIAGDKQAQVAYVQIASQTAGMINKLQSELQDYEKELADLRNDNLAKSSVIRKARESKDFPTKGTTAEKNNFIDKYWSEYIKKDPIYIRATQTAGTLRDLQQQYNEMSSYIKGRAVKQPTQSEQKVRSYNPATGQLE